MGQAQTPNRVSFANEANYAIAWFGSTLVTRRIAANVTGVELDLALRENRDAIRDAVAFLVREQNLADCESGERAQRLLSWGEDHEVHPVETAAVCSALAIHFVDRIARLHRQWPRDEALRIAVADLSRHCCTGAAQVLGGELPPEVAQAWPHFVRLFHESRWSGLWPPDV
jgi:hypothetical protein